MVYFFNNDLDRKLVIFDQNLVIHNQKRDFLDQEISWNRT